MLPGQCPRISGRSARAVPHVFARQKAPMGLFICIVGIARATTRIARVNLGHNLQRMLWLTGAGGIELDRIKVATEPSHGNWGSPCATEYRQCSAPAR